MTTPKQLEQALIEQASELLANCKPEERVDVFKAVSAFYLQLDKQAGKQPPTTNGSGKFADIKARAVSAGQREGHA